MATGRVALEQRSWWRSPIVVPTVVASLWPAILADTGEALLATAKGMRLLGYRATALTCDLSRRPPDMR